MGAKRVEDLDGFRLAGDFKREVYALVAASPDAVRAFRYRQQLEDAAADVEASVAEGFARNHPPDFALFLRYALGSLEEARTRLVDGIDRGWFAPARCARALDIARQCRRVLTALRHSQFRLTSRATPPRPTRPSTRRRRSA